MQFHLTATKESAEIFDQHDLRLPPAGLVKCHSFTVVRRREPEGHNVQHAIWQQSGLGPALQCPTVPDEAQSTRNDPKRTPAVRLRLPAPGQPLAIAGTALTNLS
jgi:hypothetical protein